MRWGRGHFCARKDEHHLLKPSFYLCVLCLLFLAEDFFSFCLFGDERHKSLVLFVNGLRLFFDIGDEGFG